MRIEAAGENHVQIGEFDQGTGRPVNAGRVAGYGEGQVAAQHPGEIPGRALVHQQARREMQHLDIVGMAQDLRERLGANQFTVGRQSFRGAVRGQDQAIGSGR